MGLPSKERARMHILFSLWNSIQRYLIPHIEENIGSLSEKETLFVRVAELAAIDKHLGPYRWAGNGRKPCRVYRQ